MVALREAHRFCRCLFVLISLVCTIGCGGDPKYPVHGKVTLADGKPLVGAVVEFGAKEGIHSAAGMVEADGTYTLATGEDAGAPPGAYRVRVILPDEDESGNADDDDPNYRRRKRPPVPRRFQGLDTSGLEFTVSDSGENNFDIVIPSK